MNSSEVDLLVKAFEASSLSRPWSDVLDALVHHLGARAAALLYRENGPTPYSINQISGRYQKMLAENGMYYIENLAKYERSEWDKIGATNTGEFFFDNDGLRETTILDQRPDLVYLREHVDVGRRVAFRLNQNKGWFDAITVGFPSRYSTIPAASLHMLRPLPLLLGKALETSRTFGLLEAKYKAVFSALNKLCIGMAIATPQGNIVLHNEAAQRIFDENGNISLSREKHLTIMSHDQTEELAESIRRTSATAQGEAHQPEVELQIAGPVSATPLLITVSPLGNSQGELDRNFRGSLITLIDLDATKDFDIVSFAKLYGLTQAESNVCAMIAQGMTYPDIAERTSKSLHTIKNQAKSILEKASCRTRSELIRLIARTVPPIF